jgi:hypothetical protein
VEVGDEIDDGPDHRDDEHEDHDGQGGDGGAQLVAPEVLEDEERTSWREALTAVRTWKTGLAGLRSLG